MKIILMNDLLHGNNEIYVIPKRPQNYVFKLTLHYMNASWIKLNFLLKIQPSLHHNYQRKLDFLRLTFN